MTCKHDIYLRNFSKKQLVSFRWTWYEFCCQCGQFRVCVKDRYGDRIRDGKWHHMLDAGDYKALTYRKELAQ